MDGSFFRLPVFRILLPLLAGILSVIQGAEWHDFPFWSLSGLVITGFLGAQWMANRFIRWHWVPGIWVMLFFYLVGFQLTLDAIEIQDDSHFSKQALDNSQVVVEVTTPPVVKTNSIRFTGEVQAILDTGATKIAKGKVWAYLPKSTDAKSVRYGDLIYCKNAFRTLEPPPNPEQFNLKAFLANQQIYHQAFLDSNEWSFTGYNQGDALFQAIYTFKSRVKNWLQQAITRPEELDVAKALVLGEKSDLDPELRQAYAGTGAMHVLAVSGLHVGIIYMILHYALSFLNLLPKGPVIKILLIIGILWFYALLTGLSPSVFRAATMFTFVTIGQNLRRHTNVFGSIMISMVILLAYDPFLITQVGFQLSYAAVLGIVLLQPRIYNLLPQSRYWLIDQIWALTAVSIAAQLATFPLTLFYFNMFPAYFLLSNLVVIPAAFLIVTAGFLFMVIHVLNVAILEHWISLLLDWFLWLLNKSIFWVQDLPMAVIDELYISIAVLVLLYGIVISGTLALVKRSKLALFATGIFVSAWVTLHVFQHWEKQHRQQLALFKAGRHSLINAITPNAVFMMGKEDILEDKEQLKFHCYRYFWKNGLSKAQLETIPLDSLQTSTLFVDQGLRATLPMLQFRDFRLAVIQPENQLPHLQKPIQVDAVLLLDNPRVTITALQKAFAPEKVIAGAGTLPWNAEDWKKSCRETGLAFHNMNKQGALVENL